MKTNSTTERRRILCLRITARDLGYAVVSGSSLLIFGVRKCRDASGEGEDLDCVAFVARLVNGFAPDLVVFGESSDRDIARKRVAVARLKSLRALASRRRLKARSYGRQRVKEILMGSPNATRLEIAQHIVERFPYLDRYLKSDLRTGRAYWMRMIDAVALGITADEELAKKRVLTALRVRNTLQQSA